MNDSITLDELGWGDWFEEYQKRLNRPDLIPARISVQYRSNYRVLTQAGELTAEVTGKFINPINPGVELPRVGDWVAVQIFDQESKAIIHELFPRRTRISRKVPERKTEEQIIAANIDEIFIVHGLDKEININRMERFQSMVQDGGARPVYVFNKSDLLTDEKEVRDALRSDVPALIVNAKSEDGMDPLIAHVKPQKTYAFIGASGVGKSTLINKLLGREKFQTREVRESDTKGRHTTSHRELVLMPGGVLLIDTPGMREIQLWDDGGALDIAFPDILELAQYCRFSDCGHRAEKDCAVKQAVDRGELAAERYEHYLRLEKELSYLKNRQDQWGRLEQKRQEKILHRAIKRFKKKK